MGKEIWDYSRIYGVLEKDENGYKGLYEFHVYNLPIVIIKDWVTIYNLLSSVYLSDNQLTCTLNEMVFDLISDKIDYGSYRFSVKSSLFDKPITSDKSISYVRIDYMDSNLCHLFDIMDTDFIKVKLKNLDKLLDCIDLQIRSDTSGLGNNYSSYPIKYIRDSLRFRGGIIDEVYLKTTLRFIINNIYVSRTLKNYISETL